MLVSLKNNNIIPKENKNKKMKIKKMDWVLLMVNDFTTWYD